MEEFKHDPKCYEVLKCNCDGMQYYKDWKHDEDECNLLHCSFCHYYEWIERGWECRDCNAYFCLTCSQKKLIDNGHYFQDDYIRCQEMKQNEKVVLNSLQHYRCNKNECIDNAKNQYKTFKMSQILHCSGPECHNYSVAGETTCYICKKCGQNFCHNCVEHLESTKEVKFGHTFSYEDYGKAICVKKKKIEK
jgi:hypothetical protein